MGTWEHALTLLGTGPEGPSYTSVAKVDWWESEGCSPWPSPPHPGASRRQPRENPVQLWWVPYYREGKCERFGAPTRLWNLSPVLRKERDNTLAFKASSTTM